MTDIEYAAYLWRWYKAELIVKSLRRISAIRSLPLGVGKSIGNAVKGVPPRPFGLNSPLTATAKTSLVAKAWRILMLRRMRFAFS